MDVLRERGTSLQTNAPDSTLKSRHGSAGGRHTGVAGLGESASVQPSTWGITDVPLAGPASELLLCTFLLIPGIRISKPAQALRAHSCSSLLRERPERSGFDRRGAGPSARLG